MPTSTVENYIKNLYQLQQRVAGKPVAMGRLATAMGVAPGTATAMIKTLSDSGLVDYTPRGGVRLNAHGEALALHVLRRHRLVELFLVNILGLDWSDVHDEAEELEHAISDHVLTRIDAMLGHPSVDPHGDPIPSAQGVLSRHELRMLAESPLHRRLRIARVIDQRKEFLRFLDRSGLTPGTVLQIEHRDSAAESLVVRAKGAQAVTLGLGAAAKIMVETV